MQKIDDEKNDSPNSASDDSSESDSSAEEEDELDAVRPMFKLPVQFDLDDLAGAFLANNQKWVWLNNYFGIIYPTISKLKGRVIVLVVYVFLYVQSRRPSSLDVTVHRSD